MPPRDRAVKPTERPTTPEATSSNPSDDRTPRPRRRPDLTTPKAPSRSTRATVQRSRSSARTAEETKLDTSVTEVPQKPLLPAFGRYDETPPSNLAQLLNMQLPPPPLFSNKTINSLAGTKSMSLTELTLAEDDALEWIVYAPSLFDNLANYAKQRMQDLEINFANRLDHDFAVAVLPWHSSVGLTPVVFTEKDIEDWVYRVLLCPALLIVLALRDEAIPTLHHGLDSAALLDEHQRGPYVSSVLVENCIPDAAIFDVKQKLKGAAEVKTEKALNDKTSQNLFDPILKTHVDRQGKERPGRPVRFIWPGTADTKGTGDKQTRILCQIFTQLVEHDCDLGMLSSYVNTGFYHREGQTLYMSPWHKNTDDVLLYVVAWMAMALDVPGFERDKLIKPLPEANFQWSEHLFDTVDAPGVVHPTLPLNLEELLAQAAPEPDRPPLRRGSRERKPVFR